MLKKKEFITLFVIVLSVPLMIVSTLNVYAETDEKLMVGTLSVQLDSQKETVTAMFVGYSEGSPVIIGPSSWEMSKKDFSKATAEEIGKRFCGQDYTMKKVTKFTNTGKEIVAEVVIEKQKEPVIVGR